MAVSTFASVPETLPSDPDTTDGRPDAIDDPTPGAPSPLADRSAEEILHEARVGVRDAQTAGLVDGVPLSEVSLTRREADMRMFEEHRIAPMLGEVYADPDAAMDRLKSLDEAGQRELLDGNLDVLGEVRSGGAASADPTALYVFADMREQFPEEAERVGQAQESDARAERAPDRDPDGTDPATHEHEQDPARKEMNDPMSMQERMSRQIEFGATAVQQI